MRYLLSLENDPLKNNYFARRLLCRTIGGNRCDYLSITGAEIPDYMKHLQSSKRIIKGDAFIQVF